MALKSAVKFRCCFARSLLFSRNDSTKCTFISRLLSTDIYDVVVAGGGMVGAAVACALAQSPVLDGKRVLILESGDPKIFEQMPDKYSNRVSAIGPGSRNFLDQIGVWAKIEAMRVKSVKRMQIWESCSESFITYQQPQMQDDVNYIVENDVITSALYNRLNQFGDRVEILKKCRVRAYELPDNRSIAPIPLVGINLEDGRSLKTRLLIGADGVRSLVRDTMKVQYVKWDYQQNAVVATLELAEPTSNIVAWQRFLPTGPIALLPLDDKMSSLVWTNTPTNCKNLLLLSDESFVDAVNSALWSGTEKMDIVENANRMMNDALKLIFPDSRSIRQLPPSVSTVDEGSRASFPLGLGHSVRYVANRVALVGDAAHRIHPLAGLGVNLGFGDAETLATVITDICLQGDDIGNLPHLLKYETSRQRIVVPTMAAIDALHRLYTTKFLPVVLLRSLGLQFTDACQPLKEKIMQSASY